MRTPTILFGLALSASAFAQSNLLQNGGFEAGPSIPAGRSEITVTGGAIPGWSVISGNVDYNGPFWTPSEGRHSVDLNGIMPGAIEQSVVVMPGWSYLVTFDLGATGTTATVVVSAAGQTSSPYAHSGPPHPTVSYARDLVWTFRAVSATERLAFSSGNPGANGPHLDNVRLTPIGPPASFATFGSGCPGSAGLPVLNVQPGSLPIVGTTLTIHVGSIPASVVAAPFGLAGLSDTTWAGIALPLSFASLGAPGCFVLVSADFVFALSNQGGFADWDIAIPLDLNLLGGRFFVQALVLDRPANALGVTLSNGATVTVGT